MLTVSSFPKADLPSWELLGHWYSRDARRVYYLNREIKEGGSGQFYGMPPRWTHLRLPIIWPVTRNIFTQNDEMIEEPLWLERLHELKPEQ